MLQTAHTSGWRRRSAVKLGERRKRINRFTGEPYFKPPNVVAPESVAAFSVTATTFPPLAASTRVNKWLDSRDDNHFITFSDSGDTIYHHQLPTPAELAKDSGDNTNAESGTHDFSNTFCGHRRLVS